MTQRIYKITLLIFAAVFSCFSYATEETYSVRKSATDIIIGASFEVIDGRYGEIGTGNFKDKETRFLVKFGIDEREDYGYFADNATIDAEVTVEALGPAGEVLTTKTEHLIIDYDPSVATNIDLDAVLDGGHYRYRVTIDDLTLTGVPSIPDYVFIEGELQVDRYYDLDVDEEPTIVSNFVAFGSDNTEYKGLVPTAGTTTDGFVWDGMAPQELEIFWSYVKGAEEYELEWTWVDNYDPNDIGSEIDASTLKFNERDFELNNTRIITKAQTYRIPLIYAKGYLIYRVRAVGRWTDNDLLDTDKLFFGAWTTTGDDPDYVSEWSNYIEISTDHEALKNWQYQAVYAEEGKKKEIISYFDGSLRNRQTVTRINSNNEAIVGENVYDNQGRSAIQILPTPVENSALRYYLELNQNIGGEAYTHNDFDWDSGECISAAELMSVESGAARYYRSATGSDTPENNWQDYVPDSDGIPFIQVEFTPDNTGRVRRQSGVGATFKIDGDHATEYFYLQPHQEELNRLFGYKVGNAQHYKKNLVVDANGQVSVSYMDPQGRVIATALAGNNLGAGPGETLTNLLSLMSHGDGDEDLDGDGDVNHTTITVDLLNKIDPTHPDTELDNNHRHVTGKQGASVDALYVNRQYASVDQQIHQFEYSVTTDVFQDDCMADGVAYPFAYNLMLNIKDDCGTSLLDYDDDGNTETPALEGVETLVSGTFGTGYAGATGTTLTLGGSSLSALLETGAYSLNKFIEVNPDTLESHLAHYLANLEPECLPDFFHNTVDCPDEYPDPAIIDDEPVFGDFDLTTCGISLETMMSDLMPGGQYGGTDPDDQASIFHLENALQQGEVLDCDWDDPACQTWQFPQDEFGDSEYYDENGDLSLIPVELVEEDPDVYSPELTTDRAGFYTVTIDGVIYAEPKYLANAEDFIANWEGTWAKSLVFYHPEYRYYVSHYKELCEETSGATLMHYEPGDIAVPISSETYNLALQFINTFADAADPANPFTTSLVPSTSSHPIHERDPYFNLTYSHLEDLADGEPYDAVNVVNNYKGALIDEIIAHYKNNNLDVGSTDLDLWEYTVKVVYCGSDFTEGCDLNLVSDPDGLYPGTGGLFDGLSTDEKDQIWNTYKQFYLAEKRKIDQILLDCYAIREQFFNGYIGASEPEGINMMAFIYYNSDHLSYDPTGIGISLTALYLDAIESVPGGDPFPWFENDEVGLFEEKVKRFEPIYGLYDAGLPEELVLEEMVSETDAEIFAATGECGLLMDAENLVRAMAENALLYHGASVNADDFPWLTEDLYTAMNGEFSGSDDVLINTTISGGGMLKVRVTNRATGSYGTTGGVETMLPIIINAPDPSDIDWTWDWDDVTNLRMMYYAPGDGLDGTYEFQILAELDEVLIGAETYYKEVVLEGVTEIAIGECYDEGDLDEPLCNRDENFANDIRAIFTHLYDDGTGDFATLLEGSDVHATTELGEWFSNSEMATQVGDNPAAPLSTIFSNSTSFSIKMEDLERIMEVNFPTLPITEISLVTGAIYDVDTKQITLYYLDEDGMASDIVGSVVTKDLLGITTDYMELDCMCDEEEQLANSFQTLFNELLNPSIVWADYNDYPHYRSDATEFLEGIYEGGEVGIKGFVLDASGFHFTLSSGEGATEIQCTFTMAVDGTYTAELASVYGIEFHVTDDPYEVVLVAYGVLTDGTIVTLERDQTSAFHNVTGCFKEVGCGCTSPSTLAPQSCTDQLEAYNSAMNDLNADLAADPDYADPDDLYDASFPILSEEEFCGTRLAYAVQAYLEYLGFEEGAATDPEDIISREDENYVSLATFAITGLNNYYVDELELSGGDWIAGTDGAIDPIQMYWKYLADGEPYLSWNDYVDGVYLVDQKICPPNALPYYPTYDLDFPCEMYTANVDTVNAKNQEDIYLEKLAQNFRERYVEEAVSSLVETFEATYFDKEYHYTLYYYDQAGNLIQTVPPKGVDRFEENPIDHEKINDARIAPEVPIIPADEPFVLPEHGLETEYHYNSLNQLVWQSTPDGGESYFGYDELGRLVVSQNAKQVLPAEPGKEQFSFTRYDDLGRIIEVGEMTLEGGDYGFDANGRFVDLSRPVAEQVLDVSNSIFPFNLGFDLTVIEELTKTQYDELRWIDPGKFEDYSADNTRNRITGVYYFEKFYFDDFVLAPDNYDNATFYDYDVHGNVKEMIQDNNDEVLEDLAQDEKKIEYEYDLVSGNVKHVTYQKDKLDQFIHEYEYDADNRITNVRTSHDNVFWEQDAKYFYYDHGPLARTEIGDKKVQSNDFAYTIQGWLKGVNSENLDETKDIGRDGRYGMAGMNKMNGKDVYGYSLHYFENDYKARFGNDFLAYSGATSLPASHNLYNGNIREMYTAATNTLEENIGTSHTVYEYDQLNRIRHMEQELLEGVATPTHTGLGGFYESDYTYDANGNLKTLNRWAKTDLDDNDIFEKSHIDDFTYHYIDESLNNQLGYVEDGIGASLLGDDLGTQSTGNYTYTEIGELLSDDQEEIERIEWKVTGKVRKIIREMTSSKSNLEFIYDAMGNRIVKIETTPAGDLIDKTYYIRDAQGNCMSIYTLTPEGTMISGDTIYHLNLTERSIYGSSRVGTENPEAYLIAETDRSILDEFAYERTIGDKRYELANHLGNVLEVVTDRKLQIEDAANPGEVDHYIADVVSQSDYYPFGMMMPGRNENEDGYRYSFQGQEKDDEIKGDNNSVNYKYRMHDPRIGRFFAVDPLMHSYPWNSPYAFSENKVIASLELEGLESYDLNGIVDNINKAISTIFSMGGVEDQLGIHQDNYVNDVQEVANDVIQAGDNIINALPEVEIFANAKFSAAVTIGAQGKIKLGKVGNGLTLGEQDLIRVGYTHDFITGEGDWDPVETIPTGQGIDEVRDELSGAWESGILNIGASLERVYEQVGTDIYSRVLKSESFTEGASLGPFGVVTSVERTYDTETGAIESITVMVTGSLSGEAAAAYGIEGSLEINVGVKVTF